MRTPSVSRSELAAPPSPMTGSEAEAVRRVSSAEGHALWAPTYDRDQNPLLALEERKLEPLLPRPRGGFALDVACGTGRWLAKLLRRGLDRAVGLDLSEEMLAQASAKVPLRGRLVCADCELAPLRGDLADLIICSFAIGYVRDLQALARELARVSRPGAYLFISDFHPAGHEHGWRRGFRQGSEVVEITSWPRPIEVICREFEKCGFKMRTKLEPCLGAPEKPVFEARGKAHVYEAVRRIPAIFICEFQLSSKLPAGGVGH
jgi:ubiquinone/menaquinone biosynthesis C-methylase UbiE